MNIYHSDAPKSLPEGRCSRHNILQCLLCERVNSNIKASPETETAVAPSAAALVEVPGWISKSPVTTIDYSASGVPMKARMAVCATCKNTVGVCEAFQVCEKPTRGMAVVWDNVNGENLKARGILIENEKAAENVWNEKQRAAAAKRIDPSSDGTTVTPIAPGFEGFAVIASRAARMGLLVIPITPGQKFPPMMKGWQHVATSNPIQIATWAQQYPQANAASMATPNGHIFIDEDNVPRIRELYREWYNEDYPNTYTTESQPGHRQSVWLQTDASRKLGNIIQLDTKEQIVSVRSKNEYVMVAGSIHPKTGKPYIVVDDSPIIPMPGNVVDFLRRLKVEGRKEKAVPKTADATSTQTAQATSTLVSAAPTVRVEQRMIVDGIPISSWAMNQERDEYADAPILGSGVIYAEPGRNDIVSQYAFRRWVMEMCSEDELWDDVREFNATQCSPPMSDDEVNEIVKKKLAMKQTGSGVLHDGVLQATPILDRWQPLKGETVEEQMQEIEERVKKNPDAIVPTLDYNLLVQQKFLAVPGPSWIDQHVQTASQLSREPLEWSIWEMLLLHGSNIICGKHGSMKSIIALAMAKALITDSGFAGRKTSGKKIRVVYCDRENPEAVVMERLIGLGLVGADGREIPGFHIWGSWPSAEFPPPEEMDDPRLIEDAKRHPETFYFFDSLSSFTGGAEENDNPEMVKHMNKVKALARMCAGTLVQHHTDKDGKKEWRGAGAIIDQSDHAMYLKRPDKKNGLITMGEIRFRACQEWNNKLRVNFSNTFPDGRIGLHISYSTLDSGIRPGALGAATGAGATGEPVSIGELVSESDAEVDLTKGDDALIQQAVGFIQQAWDEGREVNQTQLSNMLGIASSKIKARVLCTTGRPWQTRPGLRGTLYFYPIGVTIPTPEQQEAVKDAKAAAKAAAKAEAKRKLKQESRKREAKTEAKADERKRKKRAEEEEPVAV